MRIVIFCLCFNFCITTLAYSQEVLSIDDPSKVIEKELSMLSELIESSKVHLKNLVFLKESIDNYRKLQACCMENLEDQETLYKMIKLAQTILVNIKQNQLIPLFDPAFISELTILSKPAAKLGIPRP
jgi:hypothetical protein